MSQQQHTCAKLLFSRVWLYSGCEVAVDVHADLCCFTVPCSCCCYCVQDICRNYDIPTAAYGSFTDPAAAKAYIQQQGAPIVVKTSGLAAGKGVIVAQSVEEACQAVDDMMVNSVFGDAGKV